MISVTGLSLGYEANCVPGTGFRGRKACLLWIELAAVAMRRPDVGEAEKRTAALCGRPDGKSPGEGRLFVVLGRQDLLATVHARFRVHVVRTAQFARFLVFHVGIALESV